MRPLQISENYENFIDTFVQRFSGHRVYRNDIGRQIEDGTSWQLGFLIAHRILEDPSSILAIEDQPHDVSIFVTGKLRDRPAIGQIDVLRVDGVSDKLRCAKEEILAELNDGKAVYVVLPEGNKQDAEAVLRSCREVPRDRWIFVSTFDDAERLLETPAKDDPGNAGLKSKKNWPAKRLGGMFAVLAIGGLVLLVLGSSLGTVGRAPGGGAGKPSNGNSARIPSVAAFELRTLGPEDNLGCSGNRFRKSPEVAKQLPKPDQDAPVLSDGANICSFELVATNKAQEEIAVFSFLYKGGAIAPAEGGGLLASSRMDLVAPNKGLHLKHRLPRFRMSQEAWNILAFSISKNVRKDLPGTFGDMSDVQRATEMAAGLGATVYRQQVILRH